MTLRSQVKKLVKTMASQNLTLGLAESCTGGLISAMVTEIPGVSKVFLGAIVSYANEVKHDLLRVPDTVLETAGAVSKPTAEAMARGARRVLKSDWTISVTGIAGPTGGNARKPVGLVFFAIAGPDFEKVNRRIFKGNRKKIQQQAAIAAVTQLLEVLLEQLPSKRR